MNIPANNDMQDQNVDGQQTNEPVDDGFESGGQQQGSPGEQFAAQQSGNQPGGQRAAQQQPHWDGSQFTLNYRGQQITPKTREELINLAQQGYSYSEAMNRLKRERQEWEQQRNQWQQTYDKYNRFDEMLRSNPALTQHLMSQIAAWQQQNGGQAGTQQQAQQDPALMQRLNQVEQLLAQREQAEADQRLDQEISSLKQKYPNHDWNILEQELVQFAYDNNLPSLDYAYRAMMFDVQQTQARADGMKQVQQQRRQGVVQTAQPAPKPAQKAYSHGDSYNDLMQRMASELKI